MCTDIGSLPVEKSTLLAKLSVPKEEVLRNTDNVPLKRFVSTKSGLPSPSISPLIAVDGPVPVVKSTLAEKLTLPARVTTNG